MGDKLGKIAETYAKTKEFRKLPKTAQKHKNCQLRAFYGGGGLWVLPGLRGVGIPHPRYHMENPIRPGRGHTSCWSPYHTICTSSVTPNPGCLGYLFNWFFFKFSKPEKISVARICTHKLFWLQKFQPMCAVLMMRILKKSWMQLVLIMKIQMNRNMKIEKYYWDLCSCLSIISVHVWCQIDIITQK